MFCLEPKAAVFFSLWALSTAWQQQQQQQQHSQQECKHTRTSTAYAVLLMSAHAV
jgi:hypothetical protein